MIGLRMLNTKQQSIEATKTIARTLGDLNDQVVYVGGAVTSIYADDPGAQEIRRMNPVKICFFCCCSASVFYKNSLVTFLR